MKNFFLIIPLLSTISFGQSWMLLTDNDGITYNGTELLTNQIDRDFEITSVYQSDFSVNTDGFTSEAVTATGNVDAIGTLDNNLSIVGDGNATLHFVYKSLTISNIWYYSTFRYYLPSANTIVNYAISLTNMGELNGYLTGATNTWLTSTLRTKPDAAVQIRYFPGAYANVSHTDADDILYLREIGLSNSPQYGQAGNHSLDSSSVYKQAGTYSGKIIASGAGNGTTNTVSLASTLFTAVTSGLNYRFQIYAYTSTANTTLTFKLGDIELTSLVSTIGMSVVNFDFKATASTTGNILLYLDKAATVYIDQVSLRSGQ